MATNPPRIGSNHGPKVIKAGGLRLSDDPRSATEDYADVIVGDGAPSGDYGRAAGASMIYIRKDASTVATTVYITCDGGSNWSPLVNSVSDAELAAIAGLTSAADSIPIFTGLGTAALLLMSRDHNVLATIAVANATGGATTAALTLDLFRLDGTTPLASARQVLIFWFGTQYAPTAANITTITVGTATKGSIIASGQSWALVQTDAAGEFDCTVTDSADETVYFGVRTAPSCSDVTKACTVVGSNSDAAAWSA